MPPGFSDSYAAIVLAGGAARRLGGVDKPMLRVGARSLLEQMLAALDGADQRVVVGPRRSEVTGVGWTREQPAGSGPVAALAAGLAALTAPVPGKLVLCAADLPAFTASTVRRLLAALDAEPGSAGVVLRDGEDRAQWLAGAWHTGDLRSGIPDHPAGASLRSTIGRLPVTTLAARGDEARDVDTAEQLSAARAARSRAHRAR
ncbi:molybdenum cofactor guanylyltransferase [Sciscionella marina]|uniref:molybdenum cofactor guanylyltransferase n=1 Tax=Sciscionella marina TaxID=508770 RepID=UPI00037C5FEB|nr:NTP transferase domain-containing protein [Sciscionella marina]